MLAILDYKAGNQTSVLRALRFLGIPAQITANASQILNADGVIFPGVGAAGQAMAQLRSTEMDIVLQQVVAMHKPLLGICLGCQILLERSEENTTMTLGIVPGVCRHFRSEWTDGGEPIRIPHMGWNTLSMHQPSRLFEGIDADATFYFVHSYYPEPDPKLVLATCKYGYDFTAAYGIDGLWAVQFHPEKSGKPGLRLLTNFYRYCQEASCVRA
jgi:glutamine amidotransferase